jgi:site-specific DNA recombinase
MISNSGASARRPTDQAEGTLRLAWYGRLSTEDEQDPTLSFPRQLEVCTRALGDRGRIAAFFFDVESGLKALAQRGAGRVEDFALEIPHDGGLQELLAEADRPGRRFDAVIVESIDRLARKRLTSIQIQEALESFGVEVIAANEGMGLDPDARFLIRGVNEIFAERFVRDMKRKSFEGMAENARQGWWVGGRCPYGYRLEPHPHPNPHKARDGRVKHRLVLDDQRAPIVRQIFEWAALGEGYRSIVRRLNASPARYPGPDSHPRSDGSWSARTVHAILLNPVYTGTTVWNRQTSRRGADGRRAGQHFRPASEWIWSSGPTHPAIVSSDLFERVWERRRKLGNSAPPPRAPIHGPNVLRGLVTCAQCGRRLQSRPAHGRRYLRCQYAYDRGEAAAKRRHLSETVNVREEAILDLVLLFVREWVLAPAAAQAIHEHLSRTSGSDTRRRRGQIARLRQELADAERRTRNLALQMAEEPDARHPAVAAARGAIEELAERQREITTALRELDEEAAPMPVSLSAIEDALSALAAPEALENADPDALHRLLQSLDLEISYDAAAKEALVKATIAAPLVGDVGRLNSVGGGI